jgi:hypothetical protein
MSRYRQHCNGVGLHYSRFRAMQSRRPLAHQALSTRRFSKSESNPRSRANPPSSPSTASLSRVARCWHSNAYFSLFSSLFFFDPPNRFVQIPRAERWPEQGTRGRGSSERAAAASTRRRRDFLSANVADGSCVTSNAGPHGGKSVRIIAIFAFFFRYFSRLDQTNFSRFRAYLIHWFRARVARRRLAPAASGSGS